MIQEYLSDLKFPKVKEGGSSLLGGTNSANRLDYLVPPSVFQFQKVERAELFLINFFGETNFEEGLNYLDQNSSSFIRFQCILHDSGVLFPDS